MKQSKCKACDNIQEYKLLNCQKCGEEMPKTTYQTKHITNKKNIKNKPKSKSHFSGWNLLINGLIAIIPASIIIGILRELGIGGGLVMVGVLAGFVYIAGLARENKKTSLKIILSVIILISIFLFISHLTNPSNEKDIDDPLNEDIVFLETDKNPENSEQINNLYRNKKYKFRIKFPENWKIEAGDGIHIVQKASHENSTISVVVQQFDLGGEELISIQEAGTPKEFSNTVIEGIKEKFSQVKIIDYGETKIDNEPAYWVEYSASSQILDYKLKMTNIIYYLAKGNTMYSISAGTASNEYSKIKPLFTQSVGTFVLEN